MTHIFVQLIANFQQKAFGIGASYYPLRIVGYFFANLILLAHALDFGFDTPTFVFMIICGIQPHFCFLIYKLSASNRYIEVFFLWVDTFWAGTFMVLVSFSIFPTFMIFIMTCSGNIGVRGLRQFFYGLVAIFLGIICTSFFKPLSFEQTPSLFVQIASGILVAIYTLYFVYTAYRSTIYQKKLRREIELEKQRSEELLLNILPSETALELKEKGYVAAQSYELVTVMFTDFKDFTKVSEQMTPKEVVAEIDKIYREFDRIIGTYNIEKIKTIGDAYMCAGGLPRSNQTHALDVVAAAIDIRSFIQAEKEKNIQQHVPYFDIRIGIHTGPIVAGVVGIKKFSYDIWGDTVNTASRMESSGEVGKINVSESTYSFIKEKYNCSYRGKITAKNKGEIDMYFVENTLKI